MLAPKNHLILMDLSQITEMLRPPDRDMTTLKMKSFWPRKTPTSHPKAPSFKRASMSSRTTSNFTERRYLLP